MKSVDEFGTGLMMSGHALTEFRGQNGCDTVAVVVVGTLLDEPFPGMPIDGMFYALQYLAGLIARRRKHIFVLPPIQFETEEARNDLPGSLHLERQQAVNTVRMLLDRMRRSMGKLQKFIVLGDTRHLEVLLEAIGLFTASRSEAQLLEPMTIIMEEFNTGDPGSQRQLEFERRLLYGIMNRQKKHVALARLQRELTKGPILREDMLSTISSVEEALLRLFDEEFAKPKPVKAEDYILGATEQSATT